VLKREVWSSTESLKIKAKVCVCVGGVVDVETIKLSGRDLVDFQGEDKKTEDRRQLLHREFGNWGRLK
jgi:hypothetical protein